MSLRRRTLATIAAIMAVLFITLYFVARPPLKSAFDRLETERAQTDAQRLANSLDEEIGRLEQFASAWGPRDHTYRFMQGRAPDLEGEITADMLAQAGVNVMLFVDLEGRVVLSRSVDLDLGAASQEDTAVVEALLGERLLRAPGDPRAHRGGALAYADGVLLVASRSITSSDSYAAPLGTLIVARRFDDAELRHLAQDTRLSVKAFRADSARITGADASVLADMGRSQSVGVSVLSDDTLGAYALVRNLAGDPLVLLRADMPRSVHEVGQSAMLWFVGVLGIFGVAGVAVVGFGLDRSVLQRISVLSGEMAQIAIRRDLSARVKVAGKDEIASLAQDVNDALEAIQASEQELVAARDELEDRVFERTEELHSSEERYRSLVERLADGVFLLDQEGIVTFANQRAEDMAERPLAEIIGTPFVELVSPDTGKQVIEELTAGVHHPGGLTIEVRMGDNACGPAPVELRSVPLVDESGLPVGTQWIARDIAERRRFEEQLVHIANHDYLTGLFNRQFFESSLDLELAEVRRTGRGGAVLWLDVDDFKEINDTFGHQAGDEVLVGLAARLKTELRGSTVLSRLGGDEFAVLIPDIDVAEAEAIAERLVVTINSHVFTAVNHAIRLSASIGVVMYPLHGSTPGELLANADMAMYLAKASGRSCVHVHDVGELHQSEMRTRLAWNEQLSSAMREDRFRIFAQPVLDVRLGRVVRHELLIRMLVDGQIVPPIEFLPAAERLGLIRDIDRWMVRQAIRLLAEDALEGSAIEVNLSGRAFSDAVLLNDIERELIASGVAPERLGFEITETAAITDIAKAQRFIRALTQIGCRFSLDDFGSGFSSFYCLKHLPVDCLKVDGSFIRGLYDSPQDQHIVRGIVELCRGLGMEIAVEYVEDERTLELVKSLGVDLAQGYHIGCPVPVEPVERTAVESDAS